MAAEGRWTPPGSRGFPPGIRPAAQPAPSKLTTAVAVSFGGPTQGVFPGGAIVGEMLVLPPFVADVEAGSHALPIAPTPSLLGVLIATQGATVSPAGLVHLNNALDLVLGL